jgi:hypothetical protein
MKVTGISCWTCQVGGRFFLGRLVMTCSRVGFQKLVRI